MSGEGAPPAEPVIGAAGLRVAIVAARWHSTVMGGLLAGARRALADSKVTDVTEVRVPGCFELPVAAARLANHGFDALIALGVVDPRRHAAFRLRLLRRHWRTHGGRRAHRSADRVRGADLRRRCPGRGSGRLTRLQGGQGIRGGGRRPGDRRGPAPVPAVLMALAWLYLAVAIGSEVVATWSYGSCRTAFAHCR